VSFNEDLSHGDQIQGWLNKNSADFCGGTNALCNNYIVIAELVDSEGQWYTVSISDPNSPPWQIRGLVDYVMQEDVVEVSAFDDGEDDF